MIFAIFGLGPAELLILALCFGGFLTIAVVAGIVIYLTTRPKPPTRRERDDDDVEGAPN